LDEAGTLDVGTPADICVMDIRQTDQVFHDMHGGSCRGNQLFVPLLTMKDGEIVFRQIFYV
jgi:predicted amidohydrolase